MRLWHERIIHDLPRQQLLGQHRECCALRGLSWNKKHKTVNYVFEHSPYKLFLYHQKVMEEMKKRGYRADPLWEDPAYRGKNCPPYENIPSGETDSSNDHYIYPEHDNAYLSECLENLRDKGIDIQPTR
ncbi:TIGR02328 family protein [Virgibacillus halophilus]|uniref:TIGR02328 family protein n=1 Tax=Tigheibacillus halophilus TaxID=361280 RepID=A0ABU5C3S4_9BACI|nr:TIGR02328 family protein [Virgibacillus halophilus]